MGCPSTVREEEHEESREQERVGTEIAGIGPRGKGERPVEYYLLVGGDALS
jgi:hypothetical protein